MTKLADGGFFSTGDSSKNDLSIEEWTAIGDMRAAIEASAYDVKPNVK